MNRTSMDDGRNIGPAGVISGEGATLRIESLDDAFPAPRAFSRVPSTQRAGPAYYDVPLLKEHVWKWMIPAYFHMGGLGAGASMVAAVAERLDARAYRTIIPRCKAIAAGAAVVSGVLLIVDLGRPARFFYMLRVFRPTSPMSIGTWILSAAGGSSMMAAALSRAKGSLGRVGRVASLCSGVLAPPFASYTAVLVANTAVPAWQAPRRSLPALFVSSAVASAGALLTLIAQTRQEHAMARALTLCGTAGELVAGQIVERAVHGVPHHEPPLQHGRSGTLWKAAKLCTMAGLGVSLVGNRGRKLGLAAAALTTVGALCMRFGIVEAGKASARDARASFAQQRSKSARSPTRQNESESPPTNVQ
jgi:formate-dependent nitrite reductase membrane component NrfD